MDNLLIHPHCYRTGGTSLLRSFEEAVGKGKTVRVHQDHLERGGSVSVSDYRYIQGHFFYGVHAIIGVDDPRYLGLIRDPTDRFLSLVMQTSLTKEKLLEFIPKLAAGKQWLASNMQTRFMAGKRVAGMGEREWYDLEPIATQDLDRALHNLTQCVYVCTTKNIDKNLQEIGGLLGVTLQPIRDAVSEARFTLSETERSELEHALRKVRDCYDFELWDLARELEP